MGRGRLTCWRNMRWGFDQLAVRAFSRVVGIGLVGCPLVGSIVYLLCLSGNVFTASHCEVYDSIHSSLYTETPVHVKRRGNKQCVVLMSRSVSLWIGDREDTSLTKDERLAKVE